MRSAATHHWDASTGRDVPPSIPWTCSPLIGESDAVRAGSKEPENAELWDPTMSQPLRGKKAVRQNFTKWSSAFNDIRFTVKNIVESGENVAIYAEATARNTGEMELAPGEAIPATNKTVTMAIAEFLTISPQGKLTKDHTVFDSMTLMVQLGLAPSPQAVGKATGPSKLSTSR